MNLAKTMSKVGDVLFSTAAGKFWKGAVFVTGGVLTFMLGFLGGFENGSDKVITTLKEETRKLKENKEEN